MKNLLIRICWPILRFFEPDEAPTNYKKSHRVALNVVGALFLILSFVSATAANFIGGVGSLIPVIFFFCGGGVALIVGGLGSNGAVSKIWGTK